VWSIWEFFLQPIDKTVVGCIACGVSNVDRARGLFGARSVLAANALPCGVLVAHTISCTQWGVVEWRRRRFCLFVLVLTLVLSA